MKRFLPLFGLLASLALVFGADFNSVKIPNVTVTVSDFTLDYSPASKEVALRPASGGAIRTGTSDADGVVTFTRLTPGLYTLTIAAIGLDPLTLQVPNSTNTLAASVLVISAWTPPSGARYAGASANLLSLSRHLAVVDGSLELDGSPITGGGDTIWTNAGGVISPLASDNNAALQIGPSAGEASSSWQSLTSIRDISNGDDSANGFYFADYSDPGLTYYSEISGRILQTDPNDPLILFAIGAAGTNASSELDFYVEPNGTAIFIQNNDGTGNTTPTQLNPSEPDPYVFGTTYTATNGQWLARVHNNRTNKFTVDYSGLASAAGGFAKGSFTGLTTTNTFYSVAANLLSTITNVVVVQGGIIVSWTVTP